MAQSTTQPLHQPQSASGEPLLRWQVWPLIDDRLKAMCVVALLLAVSLGVCMVTGRWYLGLITLAIMNVAFWRYLLPITYEINVRGIEQQSRFRRSFTPWRVIGSVRQCERGLLLLKNQENSPLDATGGFFLPWGPHHDEVLRLLERYLTASSQGISQPGSRSTQTLAK